MTNEDNNKRNFRIKSKKARYRMSNFRYEEIKQLESDILQHNFTRANKYNIRHTNDMNKSQSQASSDLFVLKIIHFLLKLFT